MAGKVISVVLNAVVGPYQAAMARAAATTQGFSAAAKGAGSQIGNVATSTGALNAKLLGAGGAAFAIKSVADAAVGWESAFAGVRKTVDGTEMQMASLEQGLRDMSTEIPVAATELASIAEAAGQLGVETGNIEQFTETMAQLGVTTNLTSTEAATQLARFANIMGTSQDDFDRLGSSVVDLGNNFETTESEIVTLGLRMAAAGRIAGLSEGDIFGFATALTSVGVEAEAGGTAMSKVFTAINDAAIDGGDKLQTFAQTAGMSAEEFRRAFEEDAATAIAAFISGLGRISEAGGSTTAVFDDLELTDQRLMRALSSTASAGDKLTDALRTGNEAFEENIALQDEAAQRFGTTESQMQMARNAIEDLKVTIGQSLIPVIGEAASGLNDLLSANVGSGTSVGDALGIAIGAALRNPFNPGAMGEQIGNRVAQNRAIADAERVQAGIDALAGAHSWLTEKVDEGVTSLSGWVGKLGDAAGATGDVAGAQADMSAWVEDANGNLQHQLDLFEEMSADPVDQLMSALDNVEAAQTSYTEAVKEFGADSPEAAEAAWELFRANSAAAQAADNATGKYGDVEAAVVGMYEAGLINNEQMRVLLDLLGDTRREAESWERTYTMILDADLTPLQQKLANLRLDGHHVAIPGIVGAGGITMHTGGIVSGNAGKMPGLAPDERLRVLQVGEKVTSAQSAGAVGEPSGRTPTIGRQVTVGDGAIQLVVRDEQSGMRAANRELRMMELGYV